MVNQEASYYFPQLRWAWPQDGLDQLLSAVLLPDTDQAIGQFEAWLKKNDIDDAHFREHRLLAAIVNRFSGQLKHHSEYPRLMGLQRLLWTKSRMATAECTPLLSALSKAGIAVMLLKGASRTAISSAAQKSRISHDIDILIKPADFMNALDIFEQHDWQAANGESLLAIKTNAPTIRARNLFKGNFGDIDLHQWGYGQNSPITELEHQLWKNAESAEFFNVPVLVPSAEDRIALSMIHNGRNAHSHSDWVIDCAIDLQSKQLDWQRLLTLLQHPKMLVPSQAACSYLTERINLSLPSEFIEALMNHPVSLLQYWGDLLETKPRDNWSKFAEFSRGIVKQYRKFRQPKTASNVSIIKGHLKKAVSSEEVSSVPVTTSSLGGCDSGTKLFELEIEVNLSERPRSYDFELHSQVRNLAFLRKRVLINRKGAAVLSFTGTLEVDSCDQQLTLCSRPGRHFRGGEALEFQQRYSQVPFRLISWQLETKTNN